MDTCGCNTALVERCVVRSLKSLLALAGAYL
jgi:hypothetical protein